MRASVPRVDKVVFDWIQKLLEDPEAILLGYQRAQKIHKQRNQEALTHVDHARRVVERYEEELKRYAELYARSLITIDIMVEKKAELDKKIKSAREVLEEYELEIGQDPMSDEEIQDRITEIQKIRSALPDVTSLPFTKRRRLIKLFNLKFELGKQDNREYVDIIWYGELQGSYFVDNDLGEERQPL